MWGTILSMDSGNRRRLALDTWKAGRQASTQVDRLAEVGMRNAICNLATIMSPSLAFWVDGGV